jgi:hypothetical protein
LEAARDALLLQRAVETAKNYLPFEVLLEQHRELFGEKLEIPTASDVADSNHAEA